MGTVCMAVALYRNIWLRCLRQWPTILSVVISVRQLLHGDIIVPRTNTKTLWQESFAVNGQLPGTGFRPLYATYWTVSVENWRYSASTELIYVIRCARDWLRTREHHNFELNWFRESGRYSLPCLTREHRCSGVLLLTFCYRHALDRYDNKPSLSLIQCLRLATEPFSHHGNPDKMRRANRGIKIIIARENWKIRNLGRRRTDKRVEKQSGVKATLNRCTAKNRRLIDDCN